MYAGRVKHKPNEAVQRVEGGVEREDQGGQEGGQGEAQGDLEGTQYGGGDHDGAHYSGDDHDHDIWWSL